MDPGARNRSGKHIPQSVFTSQMADLAANHPVVRVRDIVAAHRGQGTLPSGAVAVTFDDGFLNNYTHAWPVLERHGIPATIYLATGYIGTGRLIWTDLLENAILETSKRRLCIDVDGVQRAYALGQEEERVRTFLEVKSLCKTLPDYTKDRAVSSIVDELQPRSSSDHPLYAFMNWEQVREMDASPLIEFGAHTVDHVSLTRVDEEEMRRQIDESVAMVARELDHPCEFFSYPEGQSDDYDSNIVAYLRAVGFDHAPTAIDGCNELASTDPFDIRRIMVGFEGRPYPFDLTG